MWEQKQNALWPIVTTEGIETYSNEEHELNASSSIEVIEEGIITCFNDEQLSNKDFSMHANEDEIDTFSK